jgi:hypothetical protein
VADFANEEDFLEALAMCAVLDFNNQLVNLLFGPAAGKTA